MEQNTDDSSFGNYEESLNSLNFKILNQTNNKFDLGNYIDNKFDLSISSISGIVKSYNLPNAKSFIDDELRSQITNLVTENKIIPPETISNLLQKILKRTILYIGSECERESFIDVEAEYDDLVKVLNSEYMELVRVSRPTLRDIMKDWELHKPSILFVSCHGLSDSLFLQDEQGVCKSYNNTDLVGFFKQRSLFTECVILSACESLSLGKLIIDTCKNVVCINRKVDITTARMFCNVFMEYLNDHSLQNASVYKAAFNYAKSYVNWEGLKDIFAFEYLHADFIGN